MLYVDQYQTLAQISIGLAGFSGIIITLQKKPAHEYAAIRRARLGDLLFASLGVIFFSFLPTLIEGVTGDAQIALRISNFIFGCYHVYLISLFFRTASGSKVDPSELMIMPFVFGVLFAQLSTAFGYFSAHVESAYLLALLWFLFIAAFNFVLLLLDPEGDGDYSN
jgi:hypothetical protein